MTSRFRINLWLSDSCHEGFGLVSKCEDHGIGHCGDVMLKIYTVRRLTSEFAVASESHVSTNTTEATILVIT